MHYPYWSEHPKCIEWRILGEQRKACISSIPVCCCKADLAFKRGVKPAFCSRHLPHSHNHQWATWWVGWRNHVPLLELVVRRPWSWSSHAFCTWQQGFVGDWREPLGWKLSHWKTLFHTDPPRSRWQQYPALHHLQWLQKHQWWVHQ